MRLELSRSELAELGALGRQYPSRWIRNALGVDLWSVQRQIANSVRDNRNTLVDSCHGIGKTRVLASIGLQFLYTYPESRVIATAPTYRQVQSILFAEVHRLHGDSWIELGGTLNQTELLVTEGWYFQGLSTNKADRFQGQHAPYILFIVDEGYGVHPAIFEAIRGGMSSGFVRLLVAGNPTDPAAWVAEAARKVDGQGRRAWNHIKVSAFDTPNFTELGITIEDIRSGDWREKQERWIKAHGALPRSYLINPDFVAEALIDFGEGSPAWQSRVIGEQPEGGDDAIIPLAWVTAAQDRWKESVAADAEEDPEIRRERQNHRMYVPIGDPEEAGIDWAEMGDDETILAMRRGRRVVPLRAWNKKEPMEAVGLCAGEMERTFERPKAARIKSDAIGVGSGPTSRLAELKWRVVAVKVSESPDDPRAFDDRTTELWWNLRELLRPDNPNPIALPPDAKMAGDLTGRKYRTDSMGRPIAEPKKEYKKRLKRSPDRGDAVVMLFAPDRAGALMDYYKQMEAKVDGQ